MSGRLLKGREHTVLTRPPARRVRLLVGVGLLGALALAAGQATGATASLKISLARPDASSRVGARAAGSCNRATAHALIKANPALNGFELPHQPLQLLCGPFTGPGSQAMAVTIGVNPTCWPVQIWAVFSFTRGSWKLVLNQPAFLDGPLVAVGSDIRVVTPVFRTGDSRCIPTGGSVARVWHWNGSRFTPGHATQVKPADPIAQATFNSPPAFGVQCYMSDRPGIQVDVVCWNFRSKQIKPINEQKATLAANGRATICRDSGSGCNLGNGGEEKIPTLGYGKQITVGRFSCSVSQDGVSCVVTATGKGFLINADTARVVP